MRASRVLVLKAEAEAPMTLEERRRVGNELQHNVPEYVFVYVQVLGAPGRAGEVGIRGKGGMNGEGACRLRPERRPRQVHLPVCSFESMVSPTPREEL